MVVFICTWQKLSEYLLRRPVGVPGFLEMWSSSGPVGPGGATGMVFVLGSRLILGQENQEFWLAFR
jgi:hypothetical protein